MARKSTDKHGATSWYCDGCGMSSPSRYGHEPPREWTYAGTPGGYFCHEETCQQLARAATLQELARELAEVAPKMDYLPREGPGSGDWVKVSARIRELSKRILAIEPVVAIEEDEGPEDEDA